MALICLPRIFFKEFRLSGSISAYVPGLCRVQSANICSKELRDPNVKKPAPWPYKTKRISKFRYFFENTVKRFDENTKIIVVDGNIAAGKSAFAKELADAFDMHFLPEPDLEKYYLSPYGHDLRKIDSLMPPSFKCCDISTYYKNPHHQNVALFQFRMYMQRLEQYIDALAHLLNTGQGVVLERSVYGDFVFLETMIKFGYVSKNVHQLYKDINKNTLEELMKPHLIVYLDISPEVALERIKKRNKPAEANSKVLTKEYLETIEYYYKQHYLKDLEKHSELLIYDWNNFGDLEVVVEDIERIDFERFSKYETKMKDWRREDDWEWGRLRNKYTNDKRFILQFGAIFRPKVAEVHHPGEEVAEFLDIIYKIPGEKFAEGFNPDAGDNVWFKTEHKGFRHNPMSRI